jgi:hypothetical protein
MPRFSFSVKPETPVPPPRVGEVGNISSLLSQVGQDMSSADDPLVTHRRVLGAVEEVAMLAIARQARRARR